MAQSSHLEIFLLCKRLCQFDIFVGGEFMEEIIVQYYDEHVKSYRRYSFLAWLDSAKGEKIRALKNKKTPLPSQRVELPEIVSPVFPKGFKSQIQSEKFENIAIPDDIHVPLEKNKITLFEVDDKKFAGVHFVERPTLSDISNFLYVLDSNKFQGIHCISVAKAQNVAYIPDIEQQKFENITFQIGVPERKEEFLLPEIAAEKFKHVFIGAIDMPQPHEEFSFTLEQEKFKDVFVSVSDVPKNTVIPKITIDKEGLQKSISMGDVVFPVFPKQFVAEIDISILSNVIQNSTKISEVEVTPHSLDKSFISVFSVPQVQITNILEQDKLTDITSIIPKSPSLLERIVIPENPILEFSPILSSMVKVQPPYITLDISSEAPEIKIPEQRFKGILPELSETFMNISNFTVCIDYNLFSDVHPCIPPTSGISSFKLSIDKGKVNCDIPEARVSTMQIPSIKVETSIFRGIKAVFPQTVDFSDVFQILSKERAIRV